MNKTTEALKLAEEALAKLDKAAFDVVTAQNQTEAGIAVRVLNTELQGSHKALAAIREVLAEPVKQEPVAWMDCHGNVKNNGEINDYIAAGWGKDKAATYSIPLYAAPVQPVKQEPVAWMYCPECGSLDVRYEDGNHKQCASCAQEWFSDIEYSDVVRQNLNRLHAAPVDAKAIRAEALEEAAKWFENITEAVSREEAAAAIRGLK